MLMEWNACSYRLFESLLLWKDTDTVIDVFENDSNIIKNLFYRKKKKFSGLTAWRVVKVTLGKAYNMARSPLTATVA